jgi:hypothetical protein
VPQNMLNGRSAFSAQPDDCRLGCLAGKGLVEKLFRRLVSCGWQSGWASE